MIFTNFSDLKFTMRDGWVCFIRAHLKIESDLFDENERCDVIEKLQACKQRGKLMNDK